MQSKTAFIALHFQNDALHENGKAGLGLAKLPERRDALLRAAGMLMSGARECNTPIISVAMEFPPDFKGLPLNGQIFIKAAEAKCMERGSWGAEFFSALAPLPSETVVPHSRINAFYQSRLEQELKTLGAEHLVLAGVATNSVVEHTARHAADMGYWVTVAEDACACAAPDLHNASMENMSFIANIRKSVDIVREWAGK